jgi:hypothetical protein
MPDFGRVLNARISNSLQLPAALERLRLHLQPGTPEHRLLHPRRIETAYEMAFLRVFIAWEDVLEQSFIRYLSGYENSIGSYAPIGGITFSRSIAAAETQLYGTQHYLLWHNPNQVIARSRSFFNLGLHEQVCQSNLARLNAFAAIRHRIAHGQDDAKTKFDNATMLLVGKRYPGGRPGPFLRELEATTIPQMQPRRWIEAISAEFAALIQQIVP